jgi:hypothetical protein
LISSEAGPPEVRQSTILGYRLGRKRWAWEQVVRPLGFAEVNAGGGVRDPGYPALDRLPVAPKSHMRIFGQPHFADNEHAMLREVSNSYGDANIFAFKKTGQQDFGTRRSPLVCRALFHLGPL